MNWESESNGQVLETQMLMTGSGLCITHIDRNVDIRFFYKIY